MVEAPKAAEVTSERARGLQRLGRRLEYATTAWNSLEAVVAIASGVAANPALAAVAASADS